MNDKKRAGSGLMAINLMTIRKWHWMSAALCFVCMILFSVTGITLHHAREWLPKAIVTKSEGNVPTSVMQVLTEQKDLKNIMPSDALLHWVKTDLQIPIAVEKIEFKNSKYVIPLNQPGKTTNIHVDEDSAKYELEISDRGWFGYFNDLHKGKGTGKAWIYFIDIFAVACIIFSITGLLLLQRYANARAQTWPLLIAGLILPLFFMFFLIH